MGGELRPDKCSYTVHEMRPTGDGDWKYVQEVVHDASPTEVQAGHSGVDELWEVDTGIEDQEAAARKITVPLIGGDAAAIKKLTAQESEKNLGLRVQPDGKCTAQMAVKKEQVEEWTSKVKTGHLPARAVWQSYHQQL